MIESLHIKNFATIEDIEMNFKEGFSILTGETGAGKSIIIGSIKLILGEKGSSDIIRTGKIETSVEAVFHLPKKTHPLSSSCSSSENELLIQRKISESGSEKGYVNGILFPLKKLKELGQELVDIYGQNDHVFLHYIENQLNYLDYYSRVIPLRNELFLTAQKLKKLCREKREIETKESERAQRLDFLEFQIKEIESAHLNRDEEELRQERSILKNAQKIRALVEEALDISYSQNHSISPLVSRLQHILGELSIYNKEFKETNEATSQFEITIREFSDFLLKFKEKHTASPERLDIIEQRLSQIEKLKRKYGSNIEEILSYVEKAKKEYNDIVTSKDKLADLAEEIKEKFLEYCAQAEKISIQRKKKAIELENQIKKEIELLGMKKARFKIEFKSFSPDLNNLENIRNHGTEEVEFLISPNPGEELRPLRKIASGGELSRIMLALKSIGKDEEKSKVLIFDEIDTGIGGKTAEFVAQKLKGLSAQNQVICITHLPQIASFATHHYKIEKKVSKNRTFTEAKKLSFEERVNEIARLLAGSHVTKTALQNAREMLEHNLGQG